MYDSPREQKNNQKWADRGRQPVEFYFSGDFMRLGKGCWYSAFQLHLDIKFSIHSKTAEFFALLTEQIIEKIQCGKFFIQ